jgi:hypothetical protein
MVMVVGLSGGSGHCFGNVPVDQNGCAHADLIRRKRQAW